MAKQANFENELNKIISDPEVKKNSALSKLFEDAKKLIDKNEAFQTVASNLAFQLKSNFDENNLAKSVIDFQLNIDKYSHIGANGIVL